MQLKVELIRFPNRRDYHGGAGIGTGLYGIGGTIKILGGRITAEGGRQTGAGIGGGAGGGVDTIVIGGTEWRSSQYNRIFL